MINSLIIFLVSLSVKQHKRTSYISALQNTEFGSISYAHFLDSRFVTYWPPGSVSTAFRHQYSIVVSYVLTLN
jgi:hypothetical protein